jgi:hypothetical protein
VAEVGNSAIYGLRQVMSAVGVRNPRKVAVALSGAAAKTAGSHPAGSFKPEGAAGAMAPDGTARRRPRSRRNGREGAANQNAARRAVRKLREAGQTQEGRRVAGNGGSQPAGDEVRKEVQHELRC